MRSFSQRQGAPHSASFLGGPRQKVRARAVLPLLLLALPIHADSPAVLTVPTAQAQCFQLEFLLRLPNLQALHFLRQVESLDDMENTSDDAAPDPRINGLDQQAQSLRRDEARDFTHLTQILKEMGAAPALQSWATSEAERLGKHILLSKDEEQDAVRQPAVADILATIDEANALKTETDDRLSSIAIWLKVSYSPGGLWAADVGELTAALHVAVTNHEQPHITLTSLRHLRDTVPANTPTPVRGVLASLVPKGGNLSAFATAITTPFPQQTLTQAHDTLLAAFAAQSLAVSDGKSR